MSDSPNRAVWRRRFTSSTPTDLDDIITVEEPLEIRLGQEGKETPVVVTMRTPGNDNELAVGFLFGEGIVRHLDDLKEVGHCGDHQGAMKNVIRVSLRDAVDFDPALLTRHFYTSSACGICGKTSIEALRQQLPASSREGPRIGSLALRGLPVRLRQAQTQFALTGGLHGAALFDGDGEVRAVREDVGRHNAVDKLIGAQVSLGKPMRNCGLLLSGRISFELVQKAAMAGISLIAAIGPPSSLALELAKGRGITLVGFLSEDGFNVYCDEQSLIIR